MKAALRTGTDIPSSSVAFASAIPNLTTQPVVLCERAQSMQCNVTALAKIQGEQAGWEDDTKQGRDGGGALWEAAGP